LYSSWLSRSLLEQLADRAELGETRGTEH